MRHELMYLNGGFWRDSGLNMFKPIFDQFTRYRLVLGAGWTGQNRWSQAMCFFANEPFSENMLRVSNYRNVNRMQMYHRNALYIAGPTDFRQVLQGEEEYSSDILLMHIEYFYPAEKERVYPDYCLKRKEEVREGEKY